MGYGNLFELYRKQVQLTARDRRRFPVAVPAKPFLKLTWRHYRGRLAPASQRLSPGRADVDERMWLLRLTLNIFLPDFPPLFAGVSTLRMSSLQPERGGGGGSMRILGLGTIGGATVQLAQILLQMVALGHAVELAMTLTQTPVLPRAQAQARICLGMERRARGPGFRADLQVMVICPRMNGTGMKQMMVERTTLVWQ